MLSEAAWLEIAKQVPWGCILTVLWVVSSRERKQIAQMYATSMREMAQECHKHQDRGTQALLDSAKALVTLAQAVGGCPVRPGHPLRDDDRDDG